MRLIDCLTEDGFWKVEVVIDGAADHWCTLEGHADALPQFDHIHISNVLAPEEYLSGIGRQQTVDVLQACGLSCTTGSDEGCDAPLVKVAGNIM
ncbi:hypothetical protein GCM10007176_02070 [Salinicoccus roseus]|nr:hypothetical protein GCM10007176_02070 [Salinicoccus roseus]